MNFKPIILLCLLKLMSISAMEVEERIETLNDQLYKAMSDHTTDKEERNKNILDLIRQGANVNFGIKIINMAEDGITPLFLVLNNPEYVETLIKLGANVNADQGLGLVPTFKIIDECLPPKSLELLLQNGAHVDHMNYYFGGEVETALIRSIKFYVERLKFSKSLSIEMIIIHKINTDLQNLLEYIDLLIKYGANPNIKDCDGKSAFDYAKDYTEILNKLKIRKYAIKKSLDEHLISPLVDIIAEY